jgi:hypothetical protein
MCIAANINVYCGLVIFSAIASLVHKEAMLAYLAEVQNRGEAAKAQARRGVAGVKPKALTPKLPALWQTEKRFTDLGQATGNGGRLSWRTSLASVASIPVRV